MFNQYFIMNLIPTPEKLKPKDWLFVETQPVVVCRIKRDLNPIEIVVVYQKNGCELFAIAFFEKDRWMFYDEGQTAEDKPELEEFLDTLREGWWWAE